MKMQNTYTSTSEKTAAVNETAHDIFSLRLPIGKRELFEIFCYCSCLEQAPSYVLAQIHA